MKPISPTDTIWNSEKTFSLTSRFHTFHPRQIPLLIRRIIYLFDRTHNPHRYFVTTHRLLESWKGRIHHIDSATAKKEIALFAKYTNAGTCQTVQALFAKQFPPQPELLLTPPPPREPEPLPPKPNYTPSPLSVEIRATYDRLVKDQGLEAAKDYTAALDQKMRERKEESPDERRSYLDWRRALCAIPTHAPTPHPKKKKEKTPQPVKISQVEFKTARRVTLSALRDCMLEGTLVEEDKEIFKRSIAEAYRKNIQGLQQIVKEMEAHIAKTNRPIDREILLLLRGQIETAKLFS